MKRITMSAIFIAVLISTFTMGAAAQTPKEQPKPGMPGMTDMSMMQSCPMTIEGASVGISDSVDGVHVAIMTKTGDVAELRHRIEAMAKMHGDMPNGSMPNMMSGKIVPFTVKYEEVQDGARLTFTPKDPAQLSELRTQVRAFAEKMKTNDCSMMQNMMKGMMDSMMQGMMKGDTKQVTPSPKATPKPEEPDHSSHH